MKELTRLVFMGLIFSLFTLFLSVGGFFLPLMLAEQANYIAAVIVFFSTAFITLELVNLLDKLELN